MKPFKTLFAILLASVFTACGSSEEAAIALVQNQTNVDVVFYSQADSLIVRSGKTEYLGDITYSSKDKTIYSFGYMALPNSEVDSIRINGNIYHMDESNRFIFWQFGNYQLCLINGMAENMVCNLTSDFLHNLMER